MKKEEALIELAQLINKLRNECLTGDRYLPMCDVRRYNQLVHDLWGDELGEDPEIEEAASKTEKTTRWIPVTERLPEKSGSYLVYVYGEVTEMDCWHGKWHMLGDDYTKAVTHWMPLPEPPEEGER